MPSLGQPASPLEGFRQPHKHSVVFYGDHRSLIDELAQFLRKALNHNSSAVIIATAVHQEALRQELNCQGLDLAAAIDQGRYLFFEAGGLLNAFMNDGALNEDQFCEVVGGILRRASAASRQENGKVVAFGEMVALLWAQGKSELAIQLEGFWNRLGRTHSFALRCAYPMQSFTSQEHAASFSQICAEHSEVILKDRHLTAITSV